MATGGFILCGKPDYSRVVRCACKVTEDQESRRLALLMACRLPESAGLRTLDNFDTNGNPSLEEAYAAAVELAEEIGLLRWLVLCGKVDMGKTHLAVGICKRWLERGKPARFSSTSLLLKELRDGFELDGEQSYRVKFDLLCRIPLLVLDDLALENPTAWAQEQIQTIIDYRYFHMLPLVITTNKPINQLGRIDPLHRISSRLQREDWTKVVMLEGQEHRFRRIKR
jgi:DNA replication protein DnaC